MPGPAEPNHVFADYLGHEKVVVDSEESDEDEQKEEVGDEEKIQSEEDSDVDIVTVGVSEHDEKAPLKEKGSK